MLAAGEKTRFVTGVTRIVEYLCPVVLDLVHAKIRDKFEALNGLLLPTERQEAKGFPLAGTVQ